MIHTNACHGAAAPLPRPPLSPARPPPPSLQADVFSFAIIAYELLHKTVMAITVASQGLQSQVEMYAYRVSQGYRPPLGDHLPPGLARLLRDCWAQSPADRPRMSKVVARLKEVQADALKMDGDDGLTANGGLANCRCTIS